MARTNMAMLFTNDVPIAITSSMTKTKAEFPKLWGYNHYIFNKYQLFYQEISEYFGSYFVIFVLECLIKRIFNTKACKTLEYLYLLMEKLLITVV